MSDGEGRRPAKGDRWTTSSGESELRRAYEAARSEGYEPDSTSMKKLADAEDRHQDRRHQDREQQEQERRNADDAPSTDDGD